MKKMIYIDTCEEFDDVFEEGKCYYPSEIASLVEKKEREEDIRNSLEYDYPKDVRDDPRWRSDVIREAERFLSNAQGGAGCDNTLYLMTIEDAINFAITEVEGR